MKKFGKNKMAILLACASVLNGKTLGVDDFKSEFQNPETVVTVNGKGVFVNPKKNLKLLSNLKRGIIIGGSLLGAGGIIGGVVATIKCLNNKKQNSETKPLEGAQAEAVKTSMDNYLKQNWVIDKSSGYFCQVAGHIGDLIEFPNNLNFGLFEKKENEAPKELDKWAGYHINKIRNFFSEFKDMGKFFKIDERPYDGKKFEILVFACNGQIIKIGVTKDTKKLHDLEFEVYYKNECNCHWSFLLNSAK